MSKHVWIRINHPIRSNVSGFNKKPQRTKLNHIYRKDVTRFGQSFHFIPIEVVPFAQRPVKERIEAVYGGECELREAQKKAVSFFLHESGVDE